MHAYDTEAKPSTLEYIYRYTYNILSTMNQMEASNDSALTMTQCITLQRQASQTIHIATTIFSTKTSLDACLLFDYIVLSIPIR